MLIACMDMIMADCLGIAKDRASHESTRIGRVRLGCIISRIRLFWQGRSIHRRHIEFLAESDLCETLIRLMYAVSKCDKLADMRLGRWATRWCKTCVVCMYRHDHVETHF